MTSDTSGGGDCSIEAKSDLVLDSPFLNINGSAEGVVGSLGGTILLRLKECVLCTIFSLGITLHFIFIV
ncbi:hypothetical protein QVD17_13364 [Tagetes erecta]|uniref:Uncharacterized protein n=1 Tax=Tagetes erecta TaxID=13708 RepID=A0AAD8NW48_TARER|nr:hypothetical protein QVD17_13364 [Tagetes erecta]